MEIAAIMSGSMSGLRKPGCDLRTPTLKEGLQYSPTGHTYSRAHELTTADVQAYVEVRQAEEAENGTINRELAALKRMFNLALHANTIARKPYIPMLEENNVRPGFFEQTQFEALLAKLPTWLRPPMTFAYPTGWRARREVFPLQWATVDLDAGTVRLEPGTTKNGDGRLIYLNDELQALLQGQWQEHQTQFPDCPYVFHRKGNRIRYHYVAWAFGL